MDLALNNYLYKTSRHETYFTNHVACFNAQCLRRQ